MTPQAPPGGKVYVLDDDASFVRSTLRLLASWGIRAEGFTSARAFLACEPTEGAACLLLDFRMPEMSGPEVQRALAARPRKLPVIFLSGHADLQAGVEAMKAGAVDFLAKTATEEHLLEAVRRALAADAAGQAARQRGREVRQGVERLSPEERRVCHLVVTGMHDNQIAEALGSSEGAVRAMRLRAMEALEAASIVELARMLEEAAEE